MTRTTEWTVRILLFEEDGTTKARAVLDTGSATLAGRGTAHCNPEDVDIPEIGDELASGRALKDLAGRLLRVADRDLAGVGAAPPPSRGPAVHGWADTLA
ncbi:MULTISPECIES: DUF1876 domain-containing protein [Streptomyces]|uniref:DUF1876 domain-containing protein n=1 Tax=Streptomyces benahoarensis TaxID=2595054 RepID=A0A553YYP0_9ACTN|nr:DUF1876 domain-containing protein [Streptomyces benahoarensis]TSB17914.1 DUF1876 domain-containing protein [Streptomyces benahoarensis]TSB34103.1 DUF1876 domain-containing protein [Streptomyces benahoarensis]